MLRKEFSSSGPGWAVHTYLRGRSILVERHWGKCTCSYCSRIRWPVALWLPANKAWNSWRIIAVRLRGSNWYMRWVRPSKRAS